MTDAERKKLAVDGLKYWRRVCRRTYRCAECEFSNEFGGCPLLNVGEHNRPSDWRFYDD